MKLKAWIDCKATPEGIAVEGHTFAWSDLPDYAKTAPLVMIRIEGRPNGWAAAPASIEQLEGLPVECFTDGGRIEALRPGPSLRRGSDVRWETIPAAGL